MHSAVVIKGGSVADGRRLAFHLQRTDTNKHVEVQELRGVAAEDLSGGLLEMEAVASATRCQKPFYHASINTPADEQLTPDQRAQAIDRLELELGLGGQPRAIVVHEKEGREHCHIVWSRIELERMRTISDSHNFRKHELVARELEREFGHARVQGAHVERDGQPRPERTPTHDEMQQAARGGVHPQDAKQFLTDLWQRSDSGQAFRSGLEEQHWQLARGDRRDFLAIDPAGGTHSLARRIEGARAKDVREKMADIDAQHLPNVQQARERAAQAEHQLAGVAAERPAAPEARASPSPPDAVRTPAPEATRTPPPEATREPPSATNREAAGWSGVTAEPAERAGEGEPIPQGPAAVSFGRAFEGGLYVGLEGVVQGSEKLIDFVADLTESVLAPPPPPQYSATELAFDPAASTVSPTT